MDLLAYTKYFAALAAVIIILLVLAFIFKRLSKGKPNVSAHSNDIFNSKTSSLFIQEVLPVDQKTKIIIVARDNVRHVILLSENHSNVIETVSPEALPQTTDLSASSNVGSISMLAPGTAPITADTTPEPDFSNIKPEAAPDEPVLTTNIKSSSDDAKKKIETDLKADLEISDDDLKEIKSKLKDAKELATPSKD